MRPVAVRLVLEIAMVWGGLWLSFSHPLFRLGLISQGALEPARIWGLYAFISFIFLLIASLVTVAIRLSFRRGYLKERISIYVRMTAFFIIITNLTAIGVDLGTQELQSLTASLQAYNPRAGHLLWLIIWGTWPWFSWVFALPFTAIFLLRAAKPQAQILQTLTRLGAFFAVLPLVVTPWVAWNWLHDQAVVEPTPVTERRHHRAPRHVMLVTFDAWRQRSTSFSVSSQKVSTPHLEALGKESLVCLNARSASDSTLVSLASIFTGLYPPRVFSISGNTKGSHRVGSVPNLVNFLKQSGYRTGYQAAMVDPRYLGVAQDFTAPPAKSWWVSFNQAEYLPLEALFHWIPHWHRRVENPFLAVYVEDGRKITRQLIDAACESLSGTDPPRFTWLHLPVPHDPYQPFDVDEPATVAGTGRSSPHAESAYENYVRFADHELGHLTEQLKAKNVWQDTLLIVTSDHGEAFHAGHPAGHGHAIPSRDVMQVPLLIHVPGQKNGEVIHEPVSHVDILPTVLDAVSGSVPNYLPGKSLLSQPLPANRMVHTWMAPDISVSTRRVICSTDGTYEYELHTLPRLTEQVFRVVPQSPVNTSSAVLNNQDVLERFRAQVELECPVVWRR